MKETVPLLKASSQHASVMMKMTLKKMKTTPKKMTKMVLMAVLIPKTKPRVVSRKIQIPKTNNNKKAEGNNKTQE